MDQGGASSKTFLCSSELVNQLRLRTPDFFLGIYLQRPDRRVRESHFPLPALSSCLWG